MSKPKLRARPVKKDPWLYPHELSPKQPKQKHEKTFLLDKSNKPDSKKSKFVKTHTKATSKPSSNSVKSPPKPTSTTAVKTVDNSDKKTKPQKDSEKKVGLGQDTRARSLDTNQNGIQNPNDNRTQLLDPLLRQKREELQRIADLTRKGTWTMSVHSLDAYWMGGRRDYANYDHIEAKVGSFDNFQHQPGGGNVQIVDHPQKVNKKSKVGSLDNLHHVPQGGLVTIVDNPTIWQSSSKVGSMDNRGHEPKQSRVKIFHEKPKWEAKSKVGSMQNILCYMYKTERCNLYGQDYGSLFIWK